MFQFAIGLMALQMAANVAAKSPTGNVSAVAGVNLLVLGDWGGIPVPPYSMPAQVHVAAAMGAMGESINAQAVISLGDNFYFDGIKTDENSKRFEQTWADVYSAPSLNIPWYLIAGNHDHYGNITAQIEYSKHFTSNTGRSWNFPSLYHTKTFTSSDADNTGTAAVTVDFVFIDTVDLSGNTEGYEMEADEANPHYYDPLPFRAREAAAEQWDWIEAQLAASTADYLFVAGHFPVFSVCEHGNTQNLVDNLKPLLLKYNATGYLAGHDHCMSVVKEPEIPMYYIVSGNGNFCCTKPEHLQDIPEDQTLEWYAAGKKLALRGGFTTIQVPDLTTGLTIGFYDQDGELLHATDSIPPRAVASTVRGIQNSGASCSELNCGQYYMNCDCDAAGKNCECSAH